MKDNLDCRQPAEARTEAGCRFSLSTSTKEPNILTSHFGLIASGGEKEKKQNTLKKVFVFPPGLWYFVTAALGNHTLADHLMWDKTFFLVWVH